MVEKFKKFVNSPIPKFDKINVDIWNKKMQELVSEAVPKIKSHIENKKRQIQELENRNEDGQETNEKKKKKKRLLA